MKPVPMEHNTSGGWPGVALTIMLWMVAKITASDAASVATLLSATSVFIINLPKLMATIRSWRKK